jgi:hypothetical protein
MAEEVYVKAMEVGQFSAAVAAIRELGVLTGLSSAARMVRLSSLRNGRRKNSLVSFASLAMTCAI